LERVAPQQRIAPVINLPPTRLAAKQVLGVGVLVAVVLVAATSLRLYAEGPDWGLQLGQAAGDGVVAVAVRGHGVAWEQHVRSGDRVLSVDALDAHNFIGQQVGRASQIVVADANGALRTVRPPQLTDALKLWLTGVAVLFALLGAVVYRWAPDARLGQIFLVFGGTTALALGSIAGAMRGYAPANFLAASSATVASAAFTTVFVWFPRPLRGARWLTAGLAAVTTGLVIPLVSLYARGEGTPPLLETSLFAWMGGNLVVGTLLLASRAVRPANRFLVAPLALGVAVGIFPLALLDALPQALGRPPIMWADSASASVAAIPMAFAYAILRHRLFALDAHLRRFILRVCAALAIVAIFVPTWFILRGIGMEDQLALVVGVAIVALVAPTIIDYTRIVLDNWFYPSLGLARAGLLTDGVASPTSIAHAFAVRSREYVPTGWAALLVRANATARDGPGWTVLGCDGDVPTGYAPPDRSVALSSLADDVPGTTILHIECSPSFWAAVCVGPRLDGTPPGGVDLETIRMLARSVLPSIEAALLREQTQAEDRFRRGLFELSLELAAVGPVSDVLRVTAQHAASLLRADSATVLRRETEDGQAYVPLGDMPELPSSEDLDTVVRLDMDGPEEQVAVSRSGHVSFVNIPDRHSMLVCWLGEPVAAEALLVLIRASLFIDEDARRAVEIAEHAAGALRRSQMSAQAAEARALREVDHLRNELMSTVAHEIRNPLTAVLGYAQMLHLKAETLTWNEVARIATQIEYSANATRDIVRDISTAALQEPGQLEVRVETIDLAAALPAIAHSFQVLPGGDRVVVDVPESVRARADPARLNQMVGNLLLNALRYASTGPIVVRASVASQTEVWIEVCDHGPGIAHDLQPRIWEKFYRVATKEPVTQGSGIGLAVVRSLAELHGGRVELDSDPGSGSIFRIVLPRAT
jgi:signal transduction histidine kinase